MTEPEKQDLIQRYLPQMKTLVDAIDTIPVCYQVQLRSVVNELSQTLIRRLRVNRLLQEALKDVRLDIKYLKFDLEATRSERDEYLRRLAATDSP